MADRTEPFIIVIFGASGDLAARKLLPALLNLEQSNVLSELYVVLGVGRSQLSDSQFRNKVDGAIQTHSPGTGEELKKGFLSRLFFHSMDTSQADDYIGLKQRLAELDTQHRTGQNFLYYLATPPSLYQNIIVNIGKQGLNKQNQNWKRMIIEKPFGYDLDSARKLNLKVLSIFEENQVYRIDHYLGKETVQNILVTRFANGIFEPLWNHHHISHVEITSSEDIGVENRGGYYETAGALRDMVQNHLLQIVGMIAMEAPSSSKANAIRNETNKVFRSLRPMSPGDVAKQVVRGQYTHSTIRKQEILAYRDEKDVDKESRVETFIAMKLFIDNWRWSNVPFYIRTGKRLPVRVTEVVIYFKPASHFIFPNENETREYNRLIIRIQPDEGLLLTFAMKTPGSGFLVEEQSLNFHYSNMEHTRLSEAYERLLLDCLLNDPTLFLRGDAMESTWTFIDPILDAWKGSSSNLYGYPAGTWGPQEVALLMDQSTHQWRYPCKNLTSDTGFCQL